MVLGGWKGSLIIVMVLERWGGFFDDRDGGGGRMEGRKEGENHSLYTVHRNAASPHVTLPFRAPLLPPLKRNNEMKYNTVPEQMK